MSNWRTVQQHYRSNIQAVKGVFEGFFTPGLISRMCVELNTDGSTDVCETAMQRRFLLEALNGSTAVYDSRKDHELAEVVEPWVEQRGALFCVMVPSPVVDGGIIQGEWGTRLAAECDLINWM